MDAYNHILDALKTMEDRGVEPTWDDFEAIAELMEEEQGSTDSAGSLPALPPTNKTEK